MPENKDRYQTGGIIEAPIKDVLVMPGETLIPHDVDEQFQAFRELYLEPTLSHIKEQHKKGKYPYISTFEMVYFILHNRYPNPKLLHLARYAKKKRVRKKNYNRLQK